MKRFWLFLLFSALTWQGVMAQDALVIKRELPPEQMNVKNSHSPRKATLLALIPGAGQAYNRKYWKMPIVYAGFGAGFYLGITNNNDYKLYKAAYDYKMNVTADVSEAAKNEAARYTADNLISLRDYYRRNMELSWIITAAWYLVQIIDANVDAHFFYYDVNDNLTLHIEPQWNTTPNTNASWYDAGNIGLSLKLNF